MPSPAAWPSLACVSSVEGCTQFCTACSSARKPLSKQLIGAALKGTLRQDDLQSLTRGELTDSGNACRRVGQPAGIQCHFLHHPRPGSGPLHIHVRLPIHPTALPVYERIVCELVFFTPIVASACRSESERRLDVWIRPSLARLPLSCQQSAWAVAEELQSCRLPDTERPFPEGQTSIGILKRRYAGAFDLFVAVPQVHVCLGPVLFHERPSAVPVQHRGVLPLHHDSECCSHHHQCDLPRAAHVWYDWWVALPSMLDRDSSKAASCMLCVWHFDVMLSRDRIQARQCI